MQLVNHIKKGTICSSYCLTSDVPIAVHFQSGSIQYAMIKINSYLKSTSAIKILSQYKKISYERKTSQWYYQIDTFTISRQVSIIPDRVLGIIGTKFLPCIVESCLSEGISQVITY